VEEGREGHRQSASYQWAIAVPHPEREEGERKRGDGGIEKKRDAVLSCLEVMFLNLSLEKRWEE
jgi:hypothetical protein